jgi:hypothetical protein
MRELVSKIIEGPLDLKLMWAAWLIVLLILVLITFKIVAKNYRVWQRLREIRK